MQLSAKPDVGGPRRILLKHLMSAWFSSLYLSHGFEGYSALTSRLSLR